MSLEVLVDRLSRAPEELEEAPYWVPSVWGVKPGPWAPPVRRVAPARFYAACAEWALSTRGKEPDRRPGWSRSAVVYNHFVRLGAAFDHDRDGVIGGAEADPTLNARGDRETGTFLKTIAILPHLVRLGVNTLHLLPITAVGRDGRKGELGSPYAIRNPERLEPTLADPLLGEMSVDDQFLALVQAARRVGIRVVLEFVFRTASLDSDWIEEHPEWFYWIDAAVPNRRPGLDPEESYGAPIFRPRQLREIEEAVTDDEGRGPLGPAGLRENRARGKGKLHEPPATYRAWFAPPPEPETIRRAPTGPVRATSPDGRIVRIPPAFADWPPDDRQPPWSDVTYLRLYDAPGRAFDYIAYNTVRAYDPDLAQDVNRVGSLWARLRGIVPGYRERFGIDGVMIDMGHALPEPLAAEIRADAREADPSLAFWEENFSIQAESAEKGFDAVVGSLIFDAHDPDRMAAFVRARAAEPAPIPFFATPENHNTPRAAARPGGIDGALARWILASFLPGAIPYIHGGFELGETEPVNTGLDFSPEELRRREGKPLGLFDRAALSWENSRRPQEVIRRVLEVRSRHAPALAAGERPPVEPAELGGTGAVGYWVDGGKGWLLVAAALEPHEGALVPLVDDRLGAQPVELVSGMKVGDGNALILPPGCAVVVKGRRAPRRVR